MFTIRELTQYARKNDLPGETPIVVDDSRVVGFSKTIQDPDNIAPVPYLHLLSETKWRGEVHYWEFEILLEIENLCDWKGTEHKGILKNKLNAIKSRVQNLIEKERERERVLGEKK